MLYVRVTLAVLMVVQISGDEDDLANSRTVLFEDLDLNRECWTIDELVLLSARKQVQDLVPKGIPDNLILLLKSFKWSLMRLGSLDTSGDIEMILLTALADAFGGYLQHVVIPVAQEAYYAGNVDYELTRQLHDLLEGFKEILGSDGGGWAAPINPSFSPTIVSPLLLNLSDSTEACKSLIVEFSHSRDDQSAAIMIPMPFFDDNAKPNAVAIPFRHRSLFNLMSPSSADILLRYYSMSMRCLVVTGSNSSVLAFNDRFLTWILTQVVPHLEESKWYPGFFGVMALIERMKLMGLKPHNDLLLGAQNNPMYTNLDLVTDEEEDDEYPDSDHKRRPILFLGWTQFLLRAAGLGCFALALSIFALWCCSYCALCYHRSQASARARLSRVQQAAGLSRRVHFEHPRAHPAEPSGNSSRPSQSNDFPFMMMCVSGDGLSCRLVRMQPCFVLVNSDEEISLPMSDFLEQGFTDVTDEEEDEGVTHSSGCASPLSEWCQRGHRKRRSST